MSKFKCPINKLRVYATDSTLHNQGKRLSNNVENNNNALIRNRKTAWGNTQTHIFAHVHSRTCMHPRALGKRPKEATDPLCR